MDWVEVFGDDRRECLRIMTELHRKMKSGVKLNRSDLRKFMRHQCFTVIMCASITPNAVSECPLTDKQCLRLIKLYNKYMANPIPPRGITDEARNNHDTEM